MSAPPAPANVFDVRTLSGLAFKGIIVPLTQMRCILESDIDFKERPCVLIRILENLERWPGTGIYRQRVECELQMKLDEYNAETAGAEVARLRQCFYRNDTDPRPLVDLANRLTTAQASPYTCLGVLAVDEGAVQPDPSTRVYSYRIAFQIHATPTR